MNNNEESVNAIENFANKFENINGDSSITKVVNEGGSKKVLFETGNTLSVGEKMSRPPLHEETFSNVVNENVTTDLQSVVKCSKCKSPCHHKDLQLTSNDLISLDNGNGSNEEITSDGTHDVIIGQSSPNDECLSSVTTKIDEKFFDPNNAADIQSKPQFFSCALNISPNPNDFDLIRKKSPFVTNTAVPSTNNELIVDLFDNSIVISNSNAVPQSDSIVSSNYSLSQLQQYISDDDDDDDGDDSSIIEEVTAAPLQYRDGDQQMEYSDDDSDSSTSSSTSILISDSSSDSESEDEFENFDRKEVCKPIKAKGELDVSDLPPIEELTISVPEEELIPIGKIYQVVDQLVIVEANKDTPAYDLDSVLFTQSGKPLGTVFDVMGPVTEPYYCIRFNSKDHIKEKNITLNQTVYAAPKTKYSKFVFLAQLMQLKGSDASWENDMEPPEIYLDYSDDEQEQKAKKKLHRNRKAMTKTDADPDEPARKKHSAYVKKMNARNLKLTAARGGSNTNRGRVDNRNILWQPNLPPSMGSMPSPSGAMAPCHQMFGRPPLFDVRVPPQNPSFPNNGRPQFHQSQMFPGPSTSQPEGPMAFPRHCTSSAPIPFPQSFSSPGPSPFSRPCPSPGPRPFSQHCPSRGPSPFSQPCPSPGSSPYSQSHTSLGPLAFPRSGPPANSMFPRPNNASVPVFSPPYGQLQSNQGVRTPPPGWNSSFHKPDNPWTRQFPPSSLRNATPPFGSFPTSNFSGSFPVRTGCPRGNRHSHWSNQVNNQGLFSQPSFNPTVPPPPPNLDQN